VKKLNKRAKGNIAVIIFMVVILITYFIWVRTYHVNFYQSMINSIVIDSSDWQKRSIDFYLRDGSIINFVVPVEDKMKIGDSVSKPANSTFFEVYRKNDSGVYYLFKQYDFKQYDNGTK